MGSYNGQFCFAKRTIEFYRLTKKCEFLTTRYEFTSLLGALLNVLNEICDKGILECRRKPVGNGSGAYDFRKGVQSLLKVKDIPRFSDILSLVQTRRPAKSFPPCSSEEVGMECYIIGFRDALTHQAHHFDDIQDDEGQIKRIKLSFEKNRTPNPLEFTLDDLERLLELLREAIYKCDPGNGDTILAHA
jgi:hypothetical protein